MNPTLVTMEGELMGRCGMRGDLFGTAELLGMDEEDVILVGSGGLTAEDVLYLNQRYPEYMGVWPIIAKIGSAIVKGGAAIGKGIVKAVKRKKAKKAAASAEAKRKAEEQAALIRQQQAIALQRQTEKEKQKKILLYAGLGVGGLLLIMFMMQRPAPEAETKKGR